MARNQPPNRSKRRSTGRRRKLGVIPFYASILFFFLVMSAFGYIYLIISLDRFAAFLQIWGVGPEGINRVKELIAGIKYPLAAWFAWLSAGLFVCGLLYLWLKAPRLALVVSIALGVVWITGVLRYQQDVEMPRVITLMFQAFGIPAVVAPQLLMGFLVLGVIGLPLLWLVRPFESMTMAIFWLMAWLILLFGMRQVRASFILLAFLGLTWITFGTGLYLAGAFIVPGNQTQKRDRIFRFIRDHATRQNRPAYAVIDEPYPDDRVETRIAGDRFADYAEGPGLVLVDSNYAAAISGGTRFKGVQGPGLIFLNYADHVKQSIDLRPQLRAFPVEALTEDGIRIKSLIFVACKIDSRNRQPELGEPLPYNKSAAYQAIQAQEIEHTGPGQSPERTEHHPWYELAELPAKRIFEDIISRHTFDELYQPAEMGAPPPRIAIAQELGQRLGQRLEEMGLQRVGGGISDIQPADPEVYEKRARSWQAEREHEIALKEARGQAEWLRTVERTRADAQADLILTLGQRLEEISEAQTEFRPQQAIKLLVQILEELLTQQPTLKEVVPNETQEALVNFQQIIGRQ